MQKIVTTLWFDGRVEEALEFYASIFPNAHIKNVSRYGDVGPGQKGDVLVATIELEGQEFNILNGGPGFPHSPAVSLMVNCETQAEVDELWEKLAEDGQHDQCGWLTDRFGVSWQIVPTALGRLMGSADEAQGQRVMQALLSMTKLDIAALERAYNGE